MNKEIEDFDKRYLKLEKERKLNKGAPDYTYIKPDQDEMIKILDEDRLTNDQKVKLDKQRIIFQKEVEAQNAVS